MKFVSRLNISQRFWGSICFFSLPLGVLLYFNIDQISEKVEFARGEIAGSRFQRPAVRLIKALGDYRVASLSGSRTAATEKLAIDAMFQQLAAVNREDGARLEFTDKDLKNAGLENLKYTAIEAEWTALQQAAPNSKPAADQYDQLVSDLRSWVSHAGDTSKLTLDPEMDTYYLADVSSVVSAQTLNRIATIMVTLEPLLRTRNPAPGDQTALAVFAASLKESDFNRITGDLDTALKENAKSARGASPTLKAALEAPAARYKADVQVLLDLLTAGSQGKAVTADQLHGAAAKASQASLELWEQTIAGLDSVLGMRIDSFANYRLKLIAGTSMALALALLIFFAMLRDIGRPLAVTVAHVEMIARGNLAGELPARFLTRQDEIGVLARAMHRMSVQLREMIREISGGVDVLAATASQLKSSSVQMTTESRTASDKAHQVAAAAEEMSAHVTSMACGMGQTTTNLAHVASATDQMTSTIGEIAVSSETARVITQRATAQAETISEQIAQLSDAARNIGKVTETINEISSQTNLLALNATIEAARAGAAGKGFAVVATEIKALSQQTAAATQDIKQRIASVQTSSASGIAELGKVSGVIRDVSDIVTSIAAAIEEQTVATKAISRNIAEASLGVTESNSQVAQFSAVSHEIARDITGVDNAANEMATGSSQVRMNADDILRISDELKQTVARFVL